MEFHLVVLERFVLQRSPLRCMLGCGKPLETGSRSRSGFLLVMSCLFNAGFRRDWFDVLQTRRWLIEDHRRRLFTREAGKLVRARLIFGRQSSIGRRTMFDFLGASRRSRRRFLLRSLDALFDFFVLEFVLGFGFHPRAEVFGWRFRHRRRGDIRFGRLLFRPIGFRRWRRQVAILGNRLAR